MTNILITGGSGFIGTHLLKFLLESNEDSRISVIDIKPPILTNDRITYHEIDIREPIDLGSNLSFDLCIHLAALCKEPGHEWDEYFDTNHFGTANVIRFCEIQTIKKIIFTSTMMVYSASDVIKDEDSQTNPNTAYGISKLLAEKELEKWLSSNRSNWLKIIRPSVVFGKDENANFTRLYLALKKGFFPFIGRRTTVKSNVYVKELLHFIDHLIKSETKPILFNFAFPSEYSIGRIVKIFKEILGIRAYNPVLPFGLMITISYIFEYLNKLGLKNSIHHRRIEKLNQSSYITPKNALESGYQFHFDLETAIKDWANDDMNLFN